ncbi:MAG: sigma-70 family polymerase sigma factor [Bacteroidetes bacterium]|jgi:RNA polymerase sigma factor (sigma-70 family)|nr:sigma-70 family polymerase sigma factor [Bacteroidota bacterium]
MPISLFSEIRGKFMCQQTDEIVWSSCLEGNQDAFEELYKRYYALLYNYGKKIVFDADFVKDCLQNFFIKLIQNHETLSRSSSVKGYMLKAFRNTLYNALKSKDERNDSLLFSSDEILSIIETEDNSDFSSDFSDNCTTIRKAFCLLSARQQEILYLYYVLEFSHSEIAEAMNINYQSSKNLLFRSLSKLKKSYLDLKNSPSKITETNTLVEISPHWDNEYCHYHLEIAK